MSPMEEYQALSLQCQYCDKEFGYLVLTKKQSELRVDIRRMLHDYRCIAVCRECCEKKGKIMDQPDDNMKYVRARLHE